MSKKEADFAWLSRQFEEIKATLLRKEEYLKVEYEKQIEGVYLRGMEMSKSENFKTINIIDNLNWFRDLKLIDFLTEMGRLIKVNTMLSRNWYLFKI